MVIDTSGNSTVKLNRNKIQELNISFLENARIFHLTLKNNTKKYYLYTNDIFYKPLLLDDIKNHIFETYSYI